MTVKNSQIEIWLSSYKGGVFRIKKESHVNELANFYKKIKHRGSDYELMPTEFLEFLTIVLKKKTYNGSQSAQLFKSINNYLQNQLKFFGELQKRNLLTYENVQISLKFPEYTVFLSKLFNLINAHLKFSDLINLLEESTCLRKENGQLDYDKSRRKLEAIDLLIYRHLLSLSALLIICQHDNELTIIEGLTILKSWDILDQENLSRLSRANSPVAICQIIVMLDRINHPLVSNITLNSLFELDQRNCSFNELVVNLKNRKKLTQNSFDGLVNAHTSEAIFAQERRELTKSLPQVTYAVYPDSSGINVNALEQVIDALEQCKTLTARSLNAFFVFFENPVPAYLSLLVKKIIEIFAENHWNLEYFLVSTLPYLKVITEFPINSRERLMDDLVAILTTFNKEDWIIDNYLLSLCHSLGYLSEIKTELISLAKLNLEWRYTRAVLDTCFNINPLSAQPLGVEPGNSVYYFSIKKLIAGLKELMENKLLSDDYVGGLFAEPKFALKLAKSITLLNKMQLEDEVVWQAILQFPEHSYHLGLALQKLKAIDVSNLNFYQTYYQILVANPADAISIVKLLAYLHKVNNSELAHSELIATHASSSKEVLGVLKLVNAAGLKAQLSLETLYAQNLNSVIFHQLLITLAEAGLLQQENLVRLINQRECFPTLLPCFMAVINKNALNQTMFETILDHPERSKAITKQFTQPYDLDKIVIGKYVTAANKLQLSDSLNSFFKTWKTAKQEQALRHDVQEKLAHCCVSPDEAEFHLGKKVFKELTKESEDSKETASFTMSFTQ